MVRRRNRKVNARCGPLFWGVMFAATAAALAASARGQDDLVPLIVELLGDKDKDVRSLAFEQVRTQAKGEAATRKFAELLPTLQPETQVGLLSALATRGDRGAAPAVRTLLTGSQDESVRLAAITALGFLGDAGDMGVLVKHLSSGKDAEQKAARASLVRLPGEAASAALVAQMQHAPAAQRIALIEILTERRTGQNELLVAAVNDDPQIRSAAMSALGRIAAPEHIAAMVPGVLKAQPGSERAAAERAVAAVCHRIAEAGDRAKLLLATMDKLDAKNRRELMPTLGRVGGPAALASAEEAYRDADPAMHAAGLAALCNWPDGSVVARLLELARTEEHPEHRTMARRALIRMAPLEDARTDARRLDLLRTLIAMCPDEKEQNQVLERAKSVRTVETLRFISPYLEKPPFAQQACLTVVELAHHSGLREPHKAEFHAALDKVIATSQNATVVDRAQRYKKGQTWVRPKPSS